MGAAPVFSPTAARTALSDAAVSVHTNVADFLATLSESVMTLAVLVAVMLVFRRSISRRALVPLGLVAYFIDFWRWLPVDPLLRVILSFSARFPKANTGLLICIVLVVCALVLFAICLHPAWRSRDRFVWGLVCSALVVTTVFFHLLTIHGVMRISFVQAEQRLGQLAALPEADLAAICAGMAIECQSHAGALQKTDTSYQHYQQFLEPRLARRPVLPPGQYFGFSWGNPDPTAGGPYVARYQERADGYRVMVDRTSLGLAFGTQSVIFGVQMVVAHHLWVWGAVVMLMAHRRGWRTGKTRGHHAVL